MTQQENSGAGDIIRCLISEGESRRAASKPYRCTCNWPGSERGKGIVERQKALLLGRGREGSSCRHKTQDKGKKSPETLLEEGEREGGLQQGSETQSQPVQQGGCLEPSLASARAGERGWGWGRLTPWTSVKSSLSF